MKSSGHIQYIYLFLNIRVPEFSSRTKIEVIVSDVLAKQIIDDIKNLSKGSASDGKVFIKRCF